MTPRHSSRTPERSSFRQLVAAMVAGAVLVACGSDGDTSATASTAAQTSTSAAAGDTTTTTAPTTTSTTTTSTTTTTTTTTTTAPAPESATYRVTILLEWSPDTHPETLPPGWHTSPPVLVAHAAPGDLVPLGSTSSPGIESMAETGKTAILLEELAANPAVGAVDTGQRVDGTGSDELEIVGTQSTSLLSLVTMLAPSPDWFVGVVDVPLFEDGAWNERIELELIPWDAGTDSGPEFTSPDADTQPRGVIDLPQDPSYVAAAGEGRFGSLVIELVG